MKSTTGYNAQGLIQGTDSVSLRLTPNIVEFLQPHFMDGVFAPSLISVSSCASHYKVSFKLPLLSSHSSLVSRQRCLQTDTAFCDNKKDQLNDYLQIFLKDDLCLPVQFLASTKRSPLSSPPASSSSLSSSGPQNASNETTETETKAETEGESLSAFSAKILQLYPTFVDEFRNTIIPLVTQNTSTVLDSLSHLSPLDDPLNGAYPKVWALINSACDERNLSLMPPSWRPWL